MRKAIPYSLAAISVLTTCSLTLAAKVEIASEGVLLIEGRKLFPIGFTMAPLPDAKTPEGKDGLAELRDAGGNFFRSGASGDDWDDETIRKEQAWLDAAAEHGMYCWPFLRELSELKPNDREKEARLRAVINKFKDHPGLGVWKNVDEPEWAKTPVADMERAYRIIKELDPNHPVCTTQAPRGTVESLRPYNVATDMLAMDIYPIGYPPGTHSLWPNKEMSMVGDYTRFLGEVAQGKPRWMVLQIAWSGVVQPGKTLRMPTFAQERFMVYQALVNGARGLFFFGGNLTQAMSPEDAKLGWNWTFWKRVLRPVIEEIGDKGPLRDAMVAPDSKLPIKVNGANDVEFCVREVGDDLFILACKREGATVKVEFAGLPEWAGSGEVLYESPRKVQAKAGQFTDWFAPFDVHVYRFSRPAAKQD